MTNRAGAGAGGTMVALGEEQGVRTARCSPAWTPRSGARSATPSRSRSPSRCSRRGPADLVEVTLALAREMLRLAGIDVDPRTPGRRPGHGRLGRWSPPGRRPGRSAAPRGFHRGGPRARPGWLRRSTPGPWAWPPGGSGPAGPGRRTRSTRGRRLSGQAGRPGGRRTAAARTARRRESLAAGRSSALHGAIEIGHEPPPEAPLVIERIGA